MTTTLPENDGTNASWLKQRSSLFNNNSSKPTKVVDKELARLKNMGVSSVWSNKFVKQDTGGTVSPRLRFAVNDMSPRPNPNYTGRSLTSPVSPKSPVFNTAGRTRTLSAASSKTDDDSSNPLGYLSKASVSSLDLNDSNTNLHRLSSARSSLTSFSSRPTSPSIEPRRKSSTTTSTITSATAPATAPATTPATTPTAAPATTPATTSPAPSPAVINTPAKTVTSIDEAASLWFQCETLKTQNAQSNARLTKANQDIDFYKRQLEQTGELARQATNLQQKKEEEEVVIEKVVVPDHIDEAASLWFQCETLKTQFAQNNAKLNKANEDIQFFKRQLEQTGELARQTVTAEAVAPAAAAAAAAAAVVTPPTKDVDEAASLWFQCETLKTQFAQTNAKLNKANEDIEFYKRQLEQTGELARKANEVVEASPVMSPVIAPTKPDHLDEAASLWFQCETLKTQFAQSNAKLNKANEDIQFFKRQLEQTGELARQTVTAEAVAPAAAAVVTPPTKDVDEAASLWFQCETLKTQFAQNNAKLNKANEDIEFYKRQLEQTGELAREAATVIEASAVMSPVVTPTKPDNLDEAASLWFQCETLKTQFAQSNAKLNKANEDIQFFKRQLEQTGELAREAAAKESKADETKANEAASLWFQCETLKTQFAQSNAKLNKANEDIEFYKRQLEHNGELARQGAAAVAEDKERESLRVRQLAELIVKQDKLLGEYEVHLDDLTRLTNESVYVGETQAEMEQLRQEVSALNKQKLMMEGSIAALRAELEMSQSQMRLMMLVSTEIQNEFDLYKDKIQTDIKRLLLKKQEEHEAQMKDLRQGLGLTPEVVVDTAVHQELVDSLRQQVNTLTEALQEKEKALITRDGALEAKDRDLVKAKQIQETTVIEMENRLKNQKMAMDAEMMKLNQTILEKDTLLMEFMSSRNNSREVISAAASMSSPTTTSSVVPAAAVTNTYYHQNESRLQINQVRDYMFSSSEDEEEESEVLMMSYSTDEEELAPQQHYRHVLNASNSTPQSPADTISSAISFDSDEEEEKIAEIKHFSYSSVQSQSTRPVSYLSTTSSMASGTEEMEHGQRSSVRNSSRSSKEVKTASWPMPPPTPPPSEPLPPVPMPVSAEIPPPRRARSKTMARDEAPNMSMYTTSVHQDNQLPRIMPIEREAPIAPPRPKNLGTLDTKQHTKWMDDPESEEDELWCEANATPKQTTAEW
ncbi:hypothetical protein INT47_012896 [Mucor saturninus]|uniref:Uncharacterized protein n=1 Tax=Mucor saturninus TaxID=64648 RepID=A0A8H7QQ32_9FUNG|nr:hypothetical protein INT47_012896 [Mucor saturninus]